MLAHLSHGNVVGYHGAWLEYVTTDNVECAIPSKFNVFVNNWGRIFLVFFCSGPVSNCLPSYRVSLF